MARSALNRSSSAPKPRRNASVRTPKASTRPVKIEDEESSAGGRMWRHDAFALLYSALALYLLFACIFYQFNVISKFTNGGKPTSVIGRICEGLSGILETYMGYCSLIVVLWCCGYALFFWRYKGGDDSSIHSRTASGYCSALFGLFITACSLGYLLWGESAGGLLGRWFMRLPMDKVGNLGAGLIAGALFLFCLAVVTALSVPELVARGLRGALRGSAHSGRVLYTSGKVSSRVILAIYEFLDARAPRKSLSEEVVPVWEKDLFGEGEEKKPKRKKAKIEAVVEEEEEDEEEFEETDEYDEEDFDEDDDDEEDEEEVYSHVVVMRRDREIAERAKKRKAQAPVKAAKYVFPDTAILTKSGPSELTEDDDVLLAVSRQIESKLRDFSVHGRVTEVHPGPVVTLYEFEPAPGVKVGKIASLQDDLAMSLKASSLRIVAPIPRKGTVGIEVPNKHRDIVRLGDLIECEAFAEAESILTIPLGKDTYGEPVVSDIATMPHLLMAGATGTGKSVLINSVLVSLLYRSTPEELGLILIDPKVLELSVYDGIPHLRVPVVTVPKQARAVLDWAAREMDRRYRLMQRFGVRSIDGYNKLVRGEGERRNLSEDVIKLVEDEIIQEGTIGAKPDLKKASEDAIAEVLQPLPKIVIVIDELADLMLTVGREIEELITRLAQKARAAGLHLIVATQRPSVDVITGLIKANFPARLSFRVASRIDSRTILDGMGAEKLLGKGDMLLMMPGGVALKRVHGAFVSDSEVKRVIDEIKKNGPPSYDERIMAICEKALTESDSGKDSGGSDEEYDQFYDKAVQLVVDKGQASTSMIQRAFRIGYNRAARIIEIMEQEGIIGPMDGVKPREVLLPNRARE